MSDHRIRQLERRALAGDVGALAQLRQEYLRITPARRCEKCSEDVPQPEWDAHLSLHELHAQQQKEVTAARLHFERTSGIPTIQIPSPGVVGGRPRKCPLYFHTFAREGETRWVLSPVQTGSNGSDRPYSWQSNVLSGSRSLAANNCFYLYRLSVLADLDSDPKALSALYDRGVFQLQFTELILHELPMRLLLNYPLKSPRTTEGVIEALEPFDSETAARDVTISGRPVEFRALEAFRFVVDVPDPLPGDMGFMVVMWGIWLQGITG